jgi:hypothetical protein
MKVSQLLLVFLFGVLALAGPTFAQDDIDEEPLVEDVIEEEAEDLREAPEQYTPPHPLTDMAEASPDIETKVVIPNFNNNEMTVGKKLTAVVGIVNTGETPVVLHFIMGSVNSPFDFNYHIQNFSLTVINSTLEAGEERTLEYQFMPHPNLDPIELRVAMTVFYEEAGIRSFSTTFFNETVSFVEGSLEFDLKSLSKYSAGITIGTAFIGALYMLLVTPTKGKSSRKTRDYSASKKTMSVEEANEWIQGAGHDMKPRSRGKK